MSEPTAVKDEKELTFKTEEEKIRAFEEIQARTPTADDIPEIERITNAKVLEESRSPAEDLAELDEYGITPEDESKEPTQKEKPEGETRNWTINEELISKYNETYTDENGRERPIFTHKDPESLLKSFADSQKYIQYTKKKHAQELEAVQQAAFEKAKSEYEEKIAEFKKSSPQQQPPVETPVKPQTVDSKILDEYNRLADEISNIPDGDEIEHIDKIRRFNALTPKVLAEKEKISSGIINQLKEELTGKYDSFKTSWESQLQQQKQIEEEQLKQQKLESVYSGIDDWTKSKNAPDEAKIDQPFKQVLREATGFNNELAELYTGKTARYYSPEEWNAIMDKAGNDYLNNVPELIQRVNQAGIQEPSNYRKWVFIDNIEALRVGYMKNSETGAWEIRYDEKTGRPINFPDMEAAYNYWLDKSGKREEIMLRQKKEDAASLMHAVTKRDTNMVQLSDNQLHGDQDGGALSEEDAANILNTLDVNMAIKDAMNGSVDNFNKINAALQRLGSAPITLDRK